MYRKALLILTILALLLVFSCSKKDNPFEPNRSGYNDAVQMNLSFLADLVPGYGGTINDQDPGTSGIQGEFEIYFEDFMNASTITMSNIDVGGVGSVTNATLTFYPEIKKAVYRGTFSDDGCFIVTLSSALQNEGGVQLDGNGNGLADGSPYDDYCYTLLTGAGVDTFDFDHPEITGVNPGNANGVDVATTIYVGFADGDMDTNTLTVSNVTLMNTENQSAINCTLVARDASGIVIQPSSELDTATQYTVNVVCSAIEDMEGNQCVGFVGDNMGYIASIPDFCWDFVTDDYGASGFDGDPPTASASAGTEELYVSFNDYMVTSTFNTDNIRVFDNNGQNLVGSILIELDERGFRYTLENAVVGTDYTLWISPMVQEQGPGDWYLDGNGNGVGGEWDDQYTYTFTY